MKYKIFKHSFLIIVIIFLMLIIVVLLIQTINQNTFFNNLKDKYFITIINDLEENGKIIIFDKKKKIYEIKAKNIASILSIEKRYLFYLETEKIENKSFIIKYDLKDSKIEEKIKIHYNDKVYHAKKIGNEIYFSNNSLLFSSKKDESAVLYSFNIISNKIKKILDYNGQGLPVITENEIIYSKENKIYSFNKKTKDTKFLYDGKLPFDYVNGYIYYVKDNDLIKKNKSGKNENVIYKNVPELGGYPTRITENLYIFIKLKVIDNSKLLDEFTEIEMINTKNGGKLDMYSLYFKGMNKKGERRSDFPLLLNTSFIFIDKDVLEPYIFSNLNKDN